MLPLDNFRLYQYGIAVEAEVFSVSMYVANWQLLFCYREPAVSLATLEFLELRGRRVLRVHQEKREMLDLRDSQV